MDRTFGVATVTPPDSPAAAQQIATSPAPAAADTSPRVLLIDDESTIRTALRRFFTRLGWSVDEAGDGRSGLAMIMTDREQRITPPYTLVISDLRMPGLSGIDLHGQLEHTCPDVLPRVIFSTGDLVSEEAADFARVTTCEVIVKPFEFAKLREKVERMTGR